MLPFADLQLFALGAATVIDTALVVMLIDRGNRRRLIVPLALSIIGSWLFHASTLGQTAWRVSSETPPLLAYRLLVLISSGGLLLMPSAMLHGVLRASITGIDYAMPRDWRYGLLYLPLLALLPFAARLFSPETLSTAAIEVLLHDWMLPYASWITVVNLGAGIGFLRLRDQLEALWARRFAGSVGWGLLILVVAHALLFFMLMPLWPQYREYWQLLAMLSPVPFVLLVGYFIVRFNFLQLILERVLIYGALVAAAVLFYQIVLRDFWQDLSNRYQIDAILLQGLVLVALIAVFKPLRRRASEALRYLFGADIADIRRRTRDFAQRLALQSSEPSERILNWFCHQGADALGVTFVAVWRIDNDRIDRRTDSVLEDQTALDLYAALQRQDRRSCTPSTAPTVTLGDALLAIEAAAVVIMEHPRISGLVMFGRGGDINQERLNALVLVVDQLALTLDNSQVQAERRLAERRAMQNDKLAALGLVASSIAHEVKNPLSSIKTIATVMQEELGPDSAHRDDLDLMIGEIERLNTTVNRLLAFARPPPSEGGSESIQASADTVLQVMRHLAKQRGVTLTTELDPALPTLRADAASVREILFNLIGNAIDASGVNGRVTLAACQRRSEIVITVSDNGPGIAPELRESLFEPFVSGKAKGTGLGLYIVAVRVRELSGHIDVQSDTSGTVFSVRLPRV